MCLFDTCLVEASGIDWAPEGGPGQKAAAFFQGRQQGVLLAAGEG